MIGSWSWYARKKAEEKENGRNERRNENDRKKEREKLLTWRIFGRRSDFIIIIDGLDFNLIV